MATTKRGSKKSLIHREPSAAMRTARGRSPEDLAQAAADHRLTSEAPRWGEPGESRRTRGYPREGGERVMAPPGRAPARGRRAAPAAAGRGAKTVAAAAPAGRVASRGKTAARTTASRTTAVRKKAPPVPKGILGLPPRPGARRPRSSR